MESLSSNLNKNKGSLCLDTGLRVFVDFGGTPQSGHNRNILGKSQGQGKGGDKDVLLFLPSFLALVALLVPFFTTASASLGGQFRPEADTVIFWLQSLSRRVCLI